MIYTTFFSNIKKSIYLFLIAFLISSFSHKVTVPSGSVASDMDFVNYTANSEETDASIALVKTSAYDDGGDCSQAGELIYYTFTVTNLGNISLTDVVVVDPLIGGEIAGPDSGDLDGDNELDADEIWIYTASYAITQDDIITGNVTNQATVTAVEYNDDDDGDDIGVEGSSVRSGGDDDGDDDDDGGSIITDLSDDNSVLEDDPTVTELCNNASIALVKTSTYDDGGDCSQAGELIYYTFTVTNLGNISLTDVVVVDPLIGGEIAGPDSGDLDGDNELDADEIWIYTASYAITQDDIITGNVTNQATVTAVKYQDDDNGGGDNDDDDDGDDDNGSGSGNGSGDDNGGNGSGDDDGGNGSGSENDGGNGSSDDDGSGDNDDNDDDDGDDGDDDDGDIIIITDLSDDNSVLEDDPTVTELCYFELEINLENKTDILCNGDDTGSITVLASGGLPPYMYNLNGGVGQSSPIFNNLSAGVYIVGVTDSIGDSDSISVTINEPEGISIQFTKINATTSGDCLNGEATITASGGLPPYTYQWSASAANQTTQTAINLPSGTHTVVVTDSNNCVLEQGVVIDCVDDCDAVIAIDNIVNVLCNGDASGSATVSASSVMNPTATFTFTWNTNPPQVDTGVTTSTVSNLSAGIYIVSVTIDGTLCLPIEQNITITEPTNALNVSATSTDETGPTTGDGTAAANATGGTPPYTYAWSPGNQTTQTITGLSAGTYTVTVTDANGCIALASVIVNPGTCHNLAANTSSTPVTCNGGSDGTATVGVTGGVGPFTYLWSPGGQTTQTITGIPVGIYTVTVTDGATLCTVISTTTVNQPGALSTGIAVTNAMCYGDNSGSLDLTVTGGISPYTFVWSPNGEITEDLFNLTAGTYSVLITDANGCTATDSAIVMQPTSALTLEIISQIDILCGSGSSVEVLATGGTPPYSYSLDLGAYQATGIFNDLSEGLHSVNVLDANGCITAIDVTILKNCTLAIDDINNTFVNLTVSGNVLTNDIDAEGDTQTVTTTTVTSVQGVTVVINATTGEYTYTPPTDYEGADSFGYNIVDNGSPQATDTAVVYIEIMQYGNPNNEPPVANADTNITEMDVPVSGNVLVNDFDPDGDSIVVTTNTTPINGNVIVNPDGSYIYTPNFGFVGQDTFMYTICDTGTPVLCDTATVTIQVLPNENNITVANDDAYYGFVDVNITGNVMDNDFDPEGDNQLVDITLSPVLGPLNGSLVLNADGSFTYTPNPGFIGNDLFVYLVNDNGTPMASDYATVYLSVNDPGNNIYAIIDINDTFVNLPISGDVGTNDRNPDGPVGTETFTLVSGPTAGGTLVFNPDGTYTYTPLLDYVGLDIFEYQICDAGNPIACSTAKVYIRVLPLDGPQNDPPIANYDTNATEINTPVSGFVLINDFDLDGDPIVVTNNTQPANGSVVVNPDGSYTYTPNPDFLGVDFFSYTVCDNGTPALCDNALVIIIVFNDVIITNSVNLTVANDDAYYGLIDMDITGNVMDNDFDPEGDNQVVDITFSPALGPFNGSLMLNADGTFTYTPNPGFVGNDQFIYRVVDDGIPSAEDFATVYFSVRNPGNVILAIDDINNTFENLSVSGDVGTNDLNFDGPVGTETFTLVSGPTAGGTLVFNPDGTYLYTPALDFIGQDTFEYQICDAGNPIACDTATVYIQIIPIIIFENEPPIANDDTNITEMDIPVSGNVLVNDFDPDGDPIVVTASTSPGSGSVVINPDGSYTYTPSFGFVGQDTFMYTICDNGTPQLCDTAVVTIQVLPNNQNITVANDDAYYGFADTIISGNLLDNDFDPEGDNQLIDISLSPVSGPANGTVTINADGSFTYTPNAGYIGTDQFVYSVFDDGVPIATDLATVYLTVRVVPNPSVALIKVGTYNDENQDGCSDVGETISYVFTVTNTGNVNLTDIMVTDPLVAVLGGPITLAPGESDAVTFTATYAITQADIDAGIVNNQATATGTDVNSVTVTDLSDDNSPLEDDPTVTELCQNASIALIKVGTYNDENQDGCSDVGETISYVFTVTNTGNVNLTDIMVTDPLVTVSGGPITLAPGESDAITFTATYAITQADIDAGIVNNQATATGIDVNSVTVTDLSDDNSPLEDDPTVTVLCQDLRIGLVMTSVVISNPIAPSPCDNEQEIEYTYFVSNEGNVSITDVVLDHPLVGGIIAGPISGDDNGNNILDIPEIWIYTANYLITQADIDAGVVITQASVDGIAAGVPIGDLSDDNSPLEDDPTVTELCQNASIALIKVGTYNDENQDGCSNIDETISYVFTVINTGNVSLTDIMVTDPMVTVLGGPITLAPGESDAVTFTATYAITQADIDAGIVNNQATATGTDVNSVTVTDLSDDNSELEDDPTTTILCQESSIALIKTATPGDENGNGCIDLGETIIYDFVVINLSNVELTNVIVTDPLVSVSGGPITLAALQSDTETFTAIYTATQADIDAGFISNQALVEGTTPNGTVVDDLSDDNSVLEDDPTILTVCQNGKIALIKTGVLNDENQDGCGAEFGETITFTFSLANEGNVAISNVDLTDPLLGGIIAGPVSGDLNGDSILDIDEVWMYTGDYTITQDDVDAQVVINQATASGLDPDQDLVSDLSDDNSVLENDATIIDLDCGLDNVPGIALIKEATIVDENGNGCPEIGETILYSFQVSNTSSNGELVNVIITDPLVDVQGGPINLAFNEIDTDTFTAIYTITQEDVDNGYIENQATVFATEPVTDVFVSDLSDDNSFLEDNITTVVFCTPVISLTLEKAGVWNDENGDFSVDVGETISYAFSVTNTGEATVYNITIDDPLPGLTVEGDPIAVLFPGETDSSTFTATYVITQEDIDNGEVVNQALVNGEDINQVGVTDESDDPTTEVLNDPTVVILPFVEGISFEIFNGVTPNGDGFNDYFQIDGIGLYPKNNVKIYNRWGVLIWETNGYDEGVNVFTGNSDARMMIDGGKNAPTGTYFYILTFSGNVQGVDYPEKKSYSGYLYLNR